MAIFASIFASLGRFLGRGLQMALGWATVMLFGQVPQSKQLLLNVVSLGSLVWVAVVIGIAIPDAATWALGFVTVPTFVEPYVRIAMLIAAIVLPVLIGVGTYILMSPEDRPRGLGIVKQVARGYLYAPVLAATLAFLLVVAPIRKVRSMAKRWTDAHVPVVVKPGGYDRVADDLEGALDRSGFQIDRRPAPSVLAWPARLLARVAGAGTRRLVPDQLVLLRGEDLEVLVYPSDIVISGKEAALAHARAAIARRLVFSAAYLTYSKETQEIEEWLEHISHTTPGVKAAGEALATPGTSAASASGHVQKAVAGDAERQAGAGGTSSRAESASSQAVSDQDDTTREFEEIDARLADLVVPYEQWEVIYRVRLQVERDLLAAREAVRREQAPEPSAAVEVLQRMAPGGDGPLAVVADAVRAAVPGVLARAMSVGPLKTLTAPDDERARSEPSDDADASVTRQPEPRT